mgnify:FL=1
MKANIVFGECVKKTFFLKLIEDKDSKFLTDFKRYFNFLKKNHDDYRNSKIIDKVSIDQPFIDYVKIISDWLEYDSDGLFTLHYSQNEYNKCNIEFDKIYVSFKVGKNIDIDNMFILLKKWKKEEYQKCYFDYLDIFNTKSEGPTIIAVY